MMKKLALVALLLQSFAVNAAFIDFNSRLQATGTTVIPWLVISLLAVAGLVRRVGRIVQVR